MPSDHSTVDAIFSDPAKVAQEHKTTDNDREPRLPWAKGITIPDTEESNEQSTNFLGAEEILIDTDDQNGQNAEPRFPLLPEFAEDPDLNTDLHKAELTEQNTELTSSLDNHLRVEQNPESHQDRALALLPDQQDQGEESFDNIDSAHPELRSLSLPEPEITTFETHSAENQHQAQQHQPVEEHRPLPKETSVLISNPPTEDTPPPNVRQKQLTPTENETTDADKLVYLQLTHKRAEIEFETLNLSDNPRHLFLLARLDATLKLLRDIIRAGSTIAKTQQEDQALIDDLYEHLSQQLTQQQKETSVSHQPMENAARASKNLAPFTLTVNEELRIKILKSKLLREIPILLGSR